VLNPYSLVTYLVFVLVRYILAHALALLRTATVSGLQ